MTTTTTPTPADVSPPAAPGKTKQVLEDKLKLHIRREFDLGEKVITLLKQKNELESGLHAQLTNKQALEAQLSEAIADKQSLEQEYAQMQRDARAQQKSLRQRSRRFSVSEEDSREDLRALTDEIQQLKQQLDVLDNQKVEEYVQLSNTIAELSKQEAQLQQELQKISYQKEIAEEELEDTAQRLHAMADVHEREKTQHEREIERLQRQQAHMEIRIAHLLDEQHRNERSLQHEIDTLKRSKAQLEEKVLQLRQQHPDDHDDEAAKNLLHVIERQENVIEQLKERAHQRSAMLRAENETLKKEVESILTRQEKINWENQMLESSLKSLQHDLAEYLLLKNKFEEAQREKEHFEAIFYRKMRFLEERYMAADRPVAESAEEAVHIHHHADQPAPPTLPPAKPRKVLKAPFRKPNRRVHAAPQDEEKTEKIPAPASSGLWLKILVPIGAALMLALSAAITIELLKIFRPMDIPTTAIDAPAGGRTLPDDKFGLNQPVEELLHEDADTSVPAPQPTETPVMAEPEKNSRSQPPRIPDAAPPKRVAAAPRPAPARPTPSAPAKPAAPPKSPPSPKAAAPTAHVASTPPKSVAPLSMPRTTTGAVVQAVKKSRQTENIVIQLAPDGNQRFLPKEQQPFPTIDNNVVVRRYQAQPRPAGINR